MTLNRVPREILRVNFHFLLNNNYLWIYILELVLLLLNTSNIFSHVKLSLKKKKPLKIIFIIVSFVHSVDSISFEYLDHEVIRYHIYYTKAERV